MLLPKEMTPFSSGNTLRMVPNVLTTDFCHLGNFSCIQHTAGCQQKRYLLIPNTTLNITYSMAWHVIFIRTTKSNTALFLGFHLSRQRPQSTSSLKKLFTQVVVARTLENCSNEIKGLIWLRAWRSN